MTPQAASTPKAGDAKDLKDEGYRSSEHDDDERDDEDDITDDERQL